MLYCEVRFHKPWRDCQKNRHEHTSSVRGGFDRDGTDLCLLHFSTSRQVSYFWSRIFRVLFHIFNPLRYTIAVSQELSTASTHPRMYMKDDRTRLVLRMRKEQRERRTEEKESHNYGNGGGRQFPPAQRWT